jgi:serine phosphatase RsbU (regulator of sigma subunit)
MSRAANYFLILFLNSIILFSQQDPRLDSLISSYTKAASDTDRINKCTDIGIYLTNSGNYTRAITYYQKTVNTFTKAYPEKCVDIKNRIAFCYLSTEEYSKADSVIKQIIAESNKLNYQKGIGLAYRNWGLIAVYTGKYKEGVAFHLKALAIWEKTKNNRLSCASNSDLGISFYYQENYKKAVYYWENAIKLNPDTASYAYANDCNNLGQTYVALGDYDKATTYLKKTQAYYANNKKSLHYTNALSGLANIESKKKNYSQALMYYNEVIKLREELSTRKSDLAITYLNMSLIYGELAKPKEALEYGLKGYQNALESEDKNELLHAYNNLNTAYAKAGNYQKAYEFSQLYTNLKDSISGIERQKQINELDKQYQTEKKEKENQLLNKQLEIQQIQGKQQQFFLIVSAVIVVLIAYLAFVLYRQNKQKQKANFKLELKNKIIEEQHKDIIDSINYAKRIQQAILKEEEHVSAHLPPHFILFKPKDIVSGDFYWALEKAEYLYITAADCTGHGVPGAFLTMLGISYLNEINACEEILSPAEILDKLRDKIVQELSRHGTTKDGMDISLMRLNLKTNEIMWAGAFNALWYVEGGILKEIKANKQPIGYVDDPKPFTNHSLRLNTNDTVYLFTDGFADQFGGPKGKKYKYKQFEESLLANNHKPLVEQKQILNASFTNWQGNLEQVDDVTVIGIKLV